MAGLNYFLDENVLRKIKRNNANDIYIAKIPTTITSRFNFDFQKQLDFDAFLYDYMSAYAINSDSKTIKQMVLTEVLTILCLDGNLEEKDPKILKNKIVDIYNGKKPIGKDERKIRNILEAINLIQEQKPEINENNFELFIHIVFRNIGYDLDTKNSYYRDKDTKTNFTNLVNEQMIDQEIKSLLDYANQTVVEGFTGFTQVFLILLDFIFISPYKEFNFTIAYLFACWYLSIISEEKIGMFVFSLQSIVLDWKNFTKKVNDSFASDFELDSLFEFAQLISKIKVNKTYRINYFDNWIKTNIEIDTKKIEFDTFDKLIISIMLGYQKKEWIFKDIHSDFSLKGILHFSEDDTRERINKFISIDIVFEDENGNFSFKNNEFEKLRMLLKN